MVSISFFYGFQAATQIFFWVATSVSGGLDGHGRTLDCPIITRPSWLPIAWLLYLRHRRIALTIAHCTTALLLWTAFLPEQRLLRFLTAAYMSATSLSVTSASHSHNELANMYISWAAALLPDDLLPGVALGVCTHFVGSSGAAKVLVGGHEWAHPGTLRTMLQQYQSLGKSDGGPASLRLSQMATKSDSVMYLLASGTLVFECLIVPLGLFIPSSLRVLLLYGLVSMHFGIAVLQSLGIGVAFVPNLAAYTMGFTADVPIGSNGWLCALVICAASICGIIISSFQPIREDWPITPFALFPWSRSQWDLLFRHLVHGDTRLVFTTDGVPPKMLVGKPAVSHPVHRYGIVTPKIADSETLVVYDGWEQWIGETLIYPALVRFLLASEFTNMARSGSAWSGRFLCEEVNLWLNSDKRLYEARTGRLMTAAYVVRVDKNEIISEVLASPGNSKSEK